VLIAIAAIFFGVQHFCIRWDFPEFRSKTEANVDSRSPLDRLSDGHIFPSSFAGGLLSGCAETRMAATYLGAGLCSWLWSSTGLS